VDYSKELEKEKERLNMLIDEAFKNGIPITKDEAVIAQNRKVDVLVAKVQREKEKNKKNKQER
jgi:hypothetical protein